MGRNEQYDWIDDAFDESKEDPLAAKGMTGCSSLAVLLCGVVIAAIVLGVLFFMFVFTPLLDSMQG